MSGSVAQVGEAYAAAGDSAVTTSQGGARDQNELNDGKNQSLRLLSVCPSPGELRSDGSWLHGSTRWYHELGIVPVPVTLPK